jgi:hypothetical protein
MTPLETAKANYLKACSESKRNSPSPWTPQEYIANWKGQLSESELIDRLNREADLIRQTDAMPSPNLD